MLQAAIECRGGLTVEEGAMMMTTELTDLPSGRAGKGDGDCGGNGDGDSDSGGNSFNNQQMLQAAMGCRGGLDCEGGDNDDDVGINHLPFDTTSQSPVPWLCRI
jgi:hypothetical protein